MTRPTNLNVLQKLGVLCVPEQRKRLGSKQALTQDPLPQLLYKLLWKAL